MAFPRPIDLPIGLKILRRLPVPHKLGVLDKLYGKTLLKFGECWVQAANGVIWKLDMSDGSSRWIVYGDYEGRNQMSWIRQWLVNGGVVIDSGANIGQMTLYFGPLSGVKVLAFEPFSYAADWLAECLNNYPNWNVDIVRLGLSDSKSTIPVQIDGPRTTARMDWYKSQDLKVTSIEVDRLDDVLFYRSVEKVRLWKLDVEGHELPALQGAVKMLSEKRIEGILIETSEKQVVEFLEQHGYRLNKIENGELKRCYLESCHQNYVALPE